MLLELDKMAEEHRFIYGVVMKELEILSNYLQGNESYFTAIEKINSIISKKEYYSRSKYSPLIRCIKSCERDHFFDFCTHLRQVLGYFNSPILIGREMYKRILPYKKRFGFVMKDTGTYEINIKNEMITDVPDLKSIYRFEKRKSNPPSISNGAVFRYFGYPSFISLQQKMLMYFICNMKYNQTLLACLPTGAGKSFSWQFMAVSEMNNGCIVVVVPTIALAINHEKSASELFAKVDGFSKTVRAYYSKLGSDRKSIIYDELSSNRLALLFVSPEALLAKEFKNNVLKAASGGNISALIVDEVHLVVSWGMKFRPEFQLLPSLRNELQEVSPAGIKTILLSATITEYDKKTIDRLFGRNGLIEYRADELRPEFEYYAHECSSEEERKLYIKKIVDQAPKPMIIYTVTPAIAEQYFDMIQDYGYSRIDLFTGNTSDESRKRIINEWNNDNIDIIVATSAFGMGVDKPDIRTIITTYIPESVSRYYQEVGRAGRDGYSALNYWLYFYEQDDKIVKNLTDTALLTEKRLSERWEALYKSAKRISADRIRIRMDSVPEDMKGNLIGKQHTNWNKDAVLLLYREGIIDIVDLQFINNKEYEIEVTLNNIPVLEDKTRLEDYISAFREEERQAINDNRFSIYTMLNYYKEECFSTFFTQEFPYAPDTCSGCPYCRAKKRMIPSIPKTIEGDQLEMTKNVNCSMLYDNHFMNNICMRGVSFVTYRDQLNEEKAQQFVELLVRYGVECFINEKWNISLLKKLYSFDRANYLLLTYDEYYLVDPEWIAGPIVFFLSENDAKNNELYNIGKALAEDNAPIVFVGKSSIIIDSEEKALNELANYNVPLDNMIGGEYL